MKDEDKNREQLIDELADLRKRISDLEKLKTKSKPFEEKLEASEERLKILFDYAPDAYYLSDIKGNLLEGNKAAEEMVGYKKEELIGKNFSDLKILPKDQLLKALKLLAKNALGFPTGPDEFILTRKDGKHITTEIATYPVRIKGQKQVLGIARDITERKKAEKTLQESEEKYRNLTTLLPQMVVELDKNSNITFANHAVFELTGYTKEDFDKHLKPSQLVIPEDQKRVNENLSRIMSGEEVGGNEYTALRKDGVEFPVVVYCSRIIRDNKLVGIRVIILDYTELKEAKDQIQKALEEKEMLLKEIHHRVKNNLMIISSLLNLQSNYIKDKASQDIFKESQNRARTMALIHERLYQSTDLKRIDFGDYIRTLSNELFRTYVADSGHIELVINVEDIFLDINTAVPLGLMVNELITNSLKHAFLAGQSGVINVDFYLKDDQYEFTVKDNGIGFPQDLDFQKTDSLGLQIVNNLTSQIDGKIELNRSHGTEFKITFKEVGV